MKSSWKSEISHFNNRRFIRREPDEALPRQWKFLLLCCLLLNSLLPCICGPRANADEKGDALLRQVHLRALALAPIAGEYTATQHGPAGDKVEKYKAVISPGGISQEGGAILPFNLFNLFDPLPQNAIAVTRCLGPQTVAGETFEVVELRRFGLTLTLYVGSDGLIHRGHTMTGALRSSVPLPGTIDPKTGLLKTPDEVALARITPPAAADAHGIDLLVTEYRKARQFPPHPLLPPPLYALHFQNRPPKNNHLPLRIALSSDGSRMMAAFWDGSAQLVDAVTGALYADLSGQPGQSTPAFSFDGKLLAVCTHNQVMTLYDASTGRVLFDLPSPMGMLWPVFSPDSRMLAVLDSGHAVKVWDTTTRQQVLSRSLEGLNWAQFSPDNQFLMTMRQEENKQRLGRLNIKTGATDQEREFPANGWYAPIALSPDGKWLVIGGQNKSLVVYDAQTGVKARDLPASESVVDNILFAADGKTLIGSGWDKRGDMPTQRTGITVWDTATWQVIGNGDLPTGMRTDPLSPLAVSADGRLLAGITIIGGVRIWAVPTK